MAVQKLTNPNGSGSDPNVIGDNAMPILYYKTEDEVPADLKEHAKVVDEEGDYKGQYSVNVVPRKKLDEFRTNNEGLAKEKEAAEGAIKKFLGVLGIKSLEEADFAKLGEDLTGLRDTARKVADGKLKASDDIDKVVEERTSVMRQKFDDELRAKTAEVANMKTERDTAVANYKRTFVDRAVASAITDPDLGVEPTALADIMQRAYGVFVVEEDGSITPKKNGQTMWGEDGTTAMSMKEWIGIVLRKDAPHYIKKSNGGGATGGGDAKQYGGLTQEEFNKLPAKRRLEIANEAAFRASKGR
jgi:hypothetical protein